MQHHPGQIELMSRVCGQIHVIKDPLHDVVYTPYIPRAKPSTKKKRRVAGEALPRAHPASVKRRLLTAEFISDT